MSTSYDYFITILPTSNVLGYYFSGTDKNGPIDESVINPTLTFNVGDEIGIGWSVDEFSMSPTITPPNPMCDHGIILRKPDLTIYEGYGSWFTEGCPSPESFVLVNCCSFRASLGSFSSSSPAPEIEDAGTWTYESNSSQPNDIGGNIIFLPWKRAKTSFFALHSALIGRYEDHSPDDCYGDWSRSNLCNNMEDIDSGWNFTEPQLLQFFYDGYTGMRPSTDPFPHRQHSDDLYSSMGSILMHSLDSIFLPDGMSMHVFDGTDQGGREIFRAVGPILIWDSIIGLNLPVNGFDPASIHARLTQMNSSLGGKWGDYITVDRIFRDDELPSDCFMINDEATSSLNNPENVERGDGFDEGQADGTIRGLSPSASIGFPHTLELRSVLSATPTTTTFPPTCGWFDENDSVGSITMDVVWEGDPASGFVRVDSKNLPICNNVECDLLPLDFVEAYREAPVRAAPVTLVVTFSQPVPNPILFINGLGGPTPMTVQFSEDFEILCTELSDDAHPAEHGTCASPITRSILIERTVTGRNGGFGIIGFPGLHSSIAFVYSGAPTNEGTPIGQYRWGFCTDLPAAQTTTTTSTTTTTEAPAALLPSSPCFVSVGSLAIGSKATTSSWSNPEIDGINAQTPDSCSFLAGIGCNQVYTESNWIFTSPTVVTFGGPYGHTVDLGTKILSSCDSIFVADGNSFHVFDHNDVEIVRFTGPCLILGNNTKSYYLDSRILDDSNPDLGGEDIQGNLSTRPSSLGGNWGDYITNDRVFFVSELPSLTQGELFYNIPNGNDLSTMYAFPSPPEDWRFEIRVPTVCGGDPITTTTLPPAYCIEETEYDADKHIIVSGPSSECLIECATSPAPTTPEPSTTTSTTADPVDDKVTCSDIAPSCLISENGTPVFIDSDIELATTSNGQTQIKIKSLSTDFQVAMGSFDPGSSDSNNDEYQSKFDNSCVSSFPESFSDAVGYLGMKFYLPSGKFLASVSHYILRHNHFLTGEIKGFIMGDIPYQYFTIEKTIEEQFSHFVSNGWDGESTLTIELIGQMFDCEPGDGNVYNACVSKTVNFTPAPVGCANYIVNLQGDKVEESSINTHWIHPEEADNNGAINFKNVHGIKHIFMIDGGSVQIKSLDRIADANEDFTIEFSFKLTSIAEGCILFSNNVSGSSSDSGLFQIGVYTINSDNTGGGSERRVRIGIQNPEYIPAGFTSPPFIYIVHSKVINIDTSNNLLTGWYTLSFSRKNGVLKFYIKERSIDLEQNSELVGSPSWFTAEEGEFALYYESEEGSKTFPCPIGRTENKLTLGFNNFYIGSKNSDQSFRGLMKNLLITNHGLGKISTFDAPMSELDPCETQEPQPELNCFSPFLQIGEQRILDGDLSITSTPFNSIINTLDSPFALSGLDGPVDSDGTRITSIDGLAIGPGYKLDVYNSNSDASSDTNKLFSFTGPLLLDGKFLGRDFFEHIDDCDSGFLSPDQREHCEAYNEDPLTGYGEVIKTFNTDITPEYPWNSIFPTWSRKFLGDPSILAILETHLRALQDIGPSPTLANLLLGKHGVLRKQTASDCIEHTFPTSTTTAEPTTSTTTTTTPFPIDVDDYGTNASSVVFEQPIEIEIQKAMGVYGEQTFHNIQDQDEALYTGLGSQSGIWHKWDIVEKSLNLLHGKASGIAGVGSSSNSYLLPENDGSDWVDLIETEHRKVIESNGFYSYYSAGRQLPTIASIWFNSDEIFAEPSFNTYDIRIGVENTSRTERTEHQLTFDQRPLSDFKIVSPVKSIRYDPNSNVIQFPQLNELSSLTDFLNDATPVIQEWYMGRDHTSNSQNPIFFEAVGDGNVYITPRGTNSNFECPLGLDFRIISLDGQARTPQDAAFAIFPQYTFSTKASYCVPMLDGDRIIIDDTIGGNTSSTWIVSFCSNHTIPLGLYDTFHNRAVANDTYNMVDRNYIQGTHSQGKGNEPVTWEIVSGAGDTHNNLFGTVEINGETHLLSRPHSDWQAVIGTIPSTVEVRVRCTITRTGTIIETPLTFDLIENRDFALPNLYLDNSSEKLKLIHKDTPDDESYRIFDSLIEDPSQNDNQEPMWKNPRYSSTQNLALVDAWSSHAWDSLVYEDLRVFMFNRLKNNNVPEDVVTIHEVKIGDGDFIPFYVSSPANTMPLSIDIDNALEPVSLGPVRLTDQASGPLRKIREINPIFTESLNTVVKLISNTDNDHILFPSCTDLQFRRYDCQGVPDIIRDRLLAGTVPESVLAWHFVGRTRTRLTTEEVGPLSSGNIITSDIYNIPSPHASGCPTEDPGFTNLYISFD